MPDAPPSYSQRLAALRRPEPRASAARRGYGRRWQRAREAWLRKHPQCVRCGRLASAAELAQFHVDHITPHRGDRKLFWDRTNWQTLCARCSNRKTAVEDGGFGRREDNGGT